MFITSAEQGSERGISLRPMAEADRDIVVDMMRGFYSSEAVFTNGSDAIFIRDVEVCLSDSPYLEGWVFQGPDGLVGYAMLAKSYSTEFGRPCIWLEDLFFEKQYRNLGLAGEFLDFLSNRYPEAVVRLDTESDNDHAVHVYSKYGFSRLPYLELIKLKE